MPATVHTDWEPRHRTFAEGVPGAGTTRDVASETPAQGDAQEAMSEYNDSPLNYGATESAESRSITTRARATVRALVDELVASLGEQRAGARGGHNRTEAATSDKGHSQSENQSLQQVDDDGAAQVLRHRDEPIAEETAGWPDIGDEPRRFATGHRTAIGDLHLRGDAPAAWITSDTFEEVRC